MPVPFFGPGHFVLLVAAACAIFLAGCNDEKPQQGPAAAGSADAAAPADTADASIRAVVNGLRENRLEALWDFLPASFQNDANALLHDFAARMDPEIWRQGVAAGRKLARVLKEKREFLKPAGDVDGAKQRPATDWGQVAELLDTVLSSDLADLEKLKTADAGKVLAETGGQLLAQARAFSKLDPRDFFGQNLDQLANLRVTFVRSSGDSAIIRFEAPDQEPALYEFVRVEGKWIPKTLSEDWIHLIGDARARLVLLSPENLGPQKPMILAYIAQADGILDDLLAADTQEQFNAAGAQGAALVRTLAALAGPLEAQAGPDEAEEEPEPTGPIATITVIVKGNLSEDAQNELGQRLQALADEHRRSFAEITGDDESVTIQLGPVAEVEAFAKQLDFLEITNVDAPSRTITAELK